jgi:hypothetical protein
MDNKEYNRKRDLIAASEASPEIKAEAMAKLTEQYVGIQMKAMKLIVESAPDLPKGD